MEGLYKVAREIGLRAICFQRGVVLVIMMLFLFVISLLGFGLLENSLLETKVSNYYHNQAQSFYKTEKLLEMYEREVLMGDLSHAQELDQDPCGAIFYKVVAAVEYKGAKSRLQSVFAKINNINDCVSIKEGRQSFLVLE